MGKIEFSYYGTGESTALQNRTGAESVHGVAISKPRGGIESVSAANRVVPRGTSHQNGTISTGMIRVRKCLDWMVQGQYLVVLRAEVGLNGRGAYFGPPRTIRVRKCRRSDGAGAVPGGSLD
jgi:hypothetical protein